ncbi:DUF72 domain-containing protein [Pseudanabaena sp. FACHB-2040]|nr:DUF72 domain-containing protein [Pseudanabaena sp. FACHB-2040]
MPPQRFGGTGVTTSFYIGCAVWAYKDWVGNFYPKGSKARDFLGLYCDRFTAVEGNTTFYSLPDAKTVERWAAEMPPTFRFCPKLPKVFSHQGKLGPHREGALQFLESLKPLGSRLGPLFIQLPPSYSPALFSDLREFLTDWPRQAFPLAVEVRHLDWFQDPVASRLNQMLSALGVGRVLLDTRPIYDSIETPADDPQIGSERKKPQVPLQPVVTAPFTLVRYISHPDLAQNQPYFKEWVPRLKQWLDEGTEVYFFAHCPKEEYSPELARYVYHQLQEEGASIPPLQWDLTEAKGGDDQEPPAQLSLF